MAVPGLNGAVRNTKGGDFVKQTISAVSLGITDANRIFSSALPINETLKENQLEGKDTLPRELIGAGYLYNAKKAVPSGVFAYNSALPSNNTVVASRMSETLAGTSNDLLLFMGQAKLRRSTHPFMGDFGVKILTAWRANLYSPLGLTNAGTKLKSRRLWLDPNNRNSVDGAPLTTLHGTNMLDLTNGDADDVALDKAATPTRALPGTYVVLVDFVDSDVATSSNYLDIKPITYA